MVTESRWHDAQAYERAYWAKVAERISSEAEEQLDWYSWKAKLMEKRLSRFLPEQMKKTARVLEIGSGPIGIVSYLRWGELYAIDPLEDFYRSNETLSKLRHNSVKYTAGGGEKLPFLSASLSLIILDNVLDHVHEAGQVLDEIGRVLLPEGICYIAVNIHKPWGGFLHSILSWLKIDRGHPYTFTLSSIRRFLSQHNFMIREEYLNSYKEAQEKDQSSSSLKDKLKAYCGLSEFVYYAVISYDSAA